MRKDLEDGSVEGSNKEVSVVVCRNINYIMICLGLRKSCQQHMLSTDATT